MATCSRCREANADRARFCQACGAPLDVTSPVRGSRRVVTVLFCDLVGSTAIGERLDPESLRRVLDRYFDAMRSPIERHGGTLEKFIGDAVMAVFGVPATHEDDALRAVRAAGEMREALHDLNQELDRDFDTVVANRIGISTGEVVTGDPMAGDRIVTGDAVNTAARLEQAAGSNEILLGIETFRLVRDAVEVEEVEPVDAKGKAAPVEARRLMRVAPDAIGVARRLDSPLVGRTRELGLLEQAFERAETDHTCQLLTVLGPAGSGKSRLVEEFLSTRDQATVVLRGRCLPYGVGITYWPVVEMVSAAAHLSPSDASDDTRIKLRRLLGELPDADVIVERLSQVLGVAGAQAAPDETFWAVRKLVEAIAARSPVVVDLDDLHWAEPTLLDLVEHVADWSRDAPILLLCSARPELLDERPGWGGGKLNAASFLLEALDPDESDRLVGNLLGGSAPADLRERIAAGSEGNPLFAEQTVAMLVDEGAIELVDGRWTWTSSVFTMPVAPTIHALLDARLDRLDPQERAVLECASIEGKVFHRGGVLAVADVSLRTDVDRHLTALVRRDLIRPETSQLEGDDAFRFRHLLIREAAYDRMPKESRADLHERFAGWLGAIAGNRALDLDEIVGYHLGRSVLLHKELGPLDDRIRAIASRAGGLINEAGDRAADRGDHAGAGDLWARALDLLPDDQPETYARLGSIKAAFDITGRRSQGDVVLIAAAERADLAGVPVQAGYARAMLAFSRVYSDPLATATQALEAIERSERALSGDQDRRSRGWCREAAATCCHWLGRIERAGELARVARDDAVAAGDRYLARIATDWLGAVLLWGPLPVQAVIDHATEESFSSTSSLPGRRGHSLAVAMQGNFEEARMICTRNLDRARELGLEHAVPSLLCSAGMVELLAHRVDEAERMLRLGFEGVVRGGELGFGSTVAGYLGLALVAIGQEDHAAALIEEWAPKTSADDYEALVLQRTCLSQVRALQGDAVEAVRLAGEAVELASGSDDVIRQAEALLAMGNALLVGGQVAEAAEAARGALERFERKGDVVQAADAREFIERLG